MKESPNLFKVFRTLFSQTVIIGFLCKTNTSLAYFLVQGKLILFYVYIIE